jgi:lipid II:glycine glycyltransferase (peptidoglycan interpeptide bridge formation enzyme)
LAYADTALVQQVLADLVDHARQVGGLFIKIDPDVPRAYGPSPENPPPEPVGQAWLSLLREQGWRFSPEQIQFRNTMLLDLSLTETELLQNMKSKWRYNIRLAERKGVTIRSGTTADIDSFYRIYAETAARDGFLIRPAAYYRDVWSLFIEQRQAELLLAEVEGEAVAGLMLFFYGQTAWYLYGASTQEQRHLMPNHLLQWQAIRRAKARGCTCYDMWGAPDNFDETDRMWGVYRFKQGFGGQVLQGLGAFDYPVKPALYWAFNAALPRLRGWLRRLR